MSGKAKKILFFVGLALLTCITFGIDQITKGEVFFGIVWTSFPIIIVVALILSLMVTKKREQKKTGTPTKSNNATDNAESNYDIETFYTSDLMKEVRKIDTDLGFTNVVGTTVKYVQYVKSNIPPTGAKVLTFWLTDTDLDFDKIAEIMELLDREIKNGTSIRYYTRSIPNNPYCNLFKRCLLGRNIVLICNDVEKEFLESLAMSHGYREILDEYVENLTSDITDDDEDLDDDKDIDDEDDWDDDDDDDYKPFTIDEMEEYEDLWED